jgi:hypothetical protein
MVSTDQESMIVALECVCDVPQHSVEMRGQRQIELIAVLNLLLRENVLDNLKLNRLSIFQILSEERKCILKSYI